VNVAASPSRSTRFTFRISRPTRRTHMDMAKFESSPPSVEGGMCGGGAGFHRQCSATAIHHVELHMERLGLGIALLAVALAVNGALGGALVVIGREQALRPGCDGTHLLRCASHRRGDRWVLSSWVDGHGDIRPFGRAGGGRLVPRSWFDLSRRLAGLNGSQDVF